MKATYFSKNGDVYHKGEPHRFIAGHQNRGRYSGSLNPHWHGGISLKEGYVNIYAPNHPRATKKGYVYEHILVAEKALGKPLPLKAEVHHVNEKRGDNTNRNLVICQDHAYHKLLHKRANALQGCGYSNWLKCPFCKTYDHPSRIVQTGYTQYHSTCHAQYEQQRRQMQKITKENYGFSK